MESISLLPDDLLLKILSLLPTAKDVVATMVLSKRWQFLWMLVPTLVYDDSYQNPQYGRFSRFVDRSLVLHEAQVIETLHFKLGLTCGSGDTLMWIKAAENRCVRELIIEVDASSSNISPITLPRSLYTFCKLVSLKLSNVVLVDDVTHPVSFPLLKKLKLESIKYRNQSYEFVNKILSGCTVLEDLVLEQCGDDTVNIMRIKVPSLKSLALHRYEGKAKNEAHGFEIDAPSLEYLDIFHSCGFCVIANNMTKVVEANIVVNYGHPWKKLSFVSSLKRLYLCVPISEGVYPVGSTFYCLVHLWICTCETQWLNVLMRVLKDAPNLQALKLTRCHFLQNNDPRPCWNEPGSVPECLVSSLETLEWLHYDGTEEEKEVIAFILRSASCLKKVTIKSLENDKKLEMLMELVSLTRRSPVCQIALI